MDFKTFTRVIGWMSSIVQWLALYSLLNAAVWVFVLFDLITEPVLFWPAVLRMIGCVLFWLAFKNFKFEDWF